MITRTRVQNKAAAGRFALGRLKTGQRNKTESAYETFLEARRRGGDVLWFKFEGVKLRLADNTFYTPDYAVMLANVILGLAPPVAGESQADQRGDDHDDADDDAKT